VGCKPLAQAILASTELQNLYETREFGKAMRLVMSLADAANEYFDENKPWVLAKNLEANRADLHQVCTNVINIFRALTIYLQPVLPELARQASAFLNLPVSSWADAS